MSKFRQGFYIWRTGTDGKIMVTGITVRDRACSIDRVPV